MTQRNFLWNQFEVLGPVGRGGMGEILHVRDQRNGQEFAAKVVRHDRRQHVGLLDQFAYEIEVHRHLQHPNIVACYHVVQNEEPMGMLLQFVRGGSVRQLLRETPGQKKPVSLMTSSEIMDMVRDITGALTYLHEQGYCHCDLKPDNILFDVLPGLSDGGRPQRRYYLSDFGICQRIGEKHDTKRGAPKYTPPEQISQEPLTAQTDVYSFAITIYEMITAGHVPFYPSRTNESQRLESQRSSDTQSQRGQAPDTQNRPTRSALDEIEEQQIVKDPPPPSHFRQGIKPAVDAVLLKALEKDPKNRYQTIQAFYVALEEALKTEVAESTQDRGIERVRLVCTTHHDFPVVKIRSLALIGRSRECSIIIPSPTISRRHVMVAWDSAVGSFAVSDQGSKLGTRINGRLVRDEKRYLREGDLLTLGDFNFRFEEIRDQG